MNILTSKLPDSVVIDGKSYKINTDFRVWIEIESVFSDSSLSHAGKLAKMLRLCYRTLPPSLGAAVDGMMSFYCQNNTEKKKGKEKNARPIFSFDYDSELIYCAFYREYGIDLQTARIHWWKFMALFKGLGDENKICQIMQYRAVNLDNIKSDEQKKFYRKMKKLYALPDLRSGDEIDYDMICGLEKIF